MEQNNEWVDDRLAKLEPEGEWQPQVNRALARFEQRRERSRWPRALGVIIVAAICVAAFPAPRAAAQRVLTPCVEACESLVSDTGDIHEHLYHLMWMVHSLMGITAPNFAATDSKGTTFKLSEYAGKVVLLNFWATWCKPCEQETPWLVEFQRTYGAQGLAVVAISMDEDGWKSVRPFMESHQINYRVALGDDALAKLYGGVESLPETLLIGPDGRVMARHVGSVTRKQYEKDLSRFFGKT